MGDRDVSAENIKVVLRVRPFSEQERGRGDRQVLRCLEDGRSVQVSSFGMEDFGRSSSVKNFSFTACAGEESDQESFYEQSGVSGLVNKALEGYSATLLAYGQTGSGKTYSVSGAEHVIVDEDYTGGDPREGVVPRAAREIYQAVEARGGGVSYSVKAACFEIYNEQVLDLLNPAAGQLAIRESKAQGFFVENLLVVECHSVADLMEVFKEGMRNRHVGAHTLNRDSSRSHSLLVIYLDSTRTDPDTGVEVTQYGKLTFVDLAGSERLKSSGSAGEMKKETGQINKSLFTLGKVISTLDRGEAFVPYRDSKLTKLLMDSLGGASTCVMVACCSPSARYIEETLSTLSYASRALNITNTPVVQLDGPQRIIQHLRGEVQTLRAENAHLRMQMGLSLTDVIRPCTSARTHAAAFGGAGDEDGGRRAGDSRQGRKVDSEVNGGGGMARSLASPLPKMSKVETAQLYDKAVGYAEGYAAGLDQAKEMLATGGLDLVAHNLNQYDIAGTAAGPRPARSHVPAGETPGTPATYRSPSRSHAPSQSAGGAHTSGSMGPSSRAGGGAAELPPLPPLLQGLETAPAHELEQMSQPQLQQLVMRLQAAHTQEQSKSERLRTECLRLQALLDDANLSTPTAWSRSPADVPAPSVSARTASDALPETVSDKCVDAFPQAVSGKSSGAFSEAPERFARGRQRPAVAVGAFDDSEGASPAALQAAAEASSESRGRDRRSVDVSHRDGHPHSTASPRIRADLVPTAAHDLPSARRGSEFRHAEATLFCKTEEQIWDAVAPVTAPGSARQSWGAAEAAEGWAAGRLGEGAAAAAAGSAGPSRAGRREPHRKPRENGSGEVPLSANAVGHLNDDGQASGGEGGARRAKPRANIAALRSF